MGFIEDLTKLIKNLIAPDLESMKTSLEYLGKNIDRTLQENKELKEEQKRLAERLSKLEGGWDGLKLAVATQVENEVLKIQAPQSRKSKELE